MKIKAFRLCERRKECVLGTAVSANSYSPEPRSGELRTRRRRCGHGLQPAERKPSLRRAVRQINVRSVDLRKCEALLPIIYTYTSKNVDVYHNIIRILSVVILQHI